jgi:hypothetical protein
MVYRIRYVEPKKGRPATETIEANSPAEAMVKFNVMHGVGARTSKPGLITSVCAEEFVSGNQW